MKTYKLIITAAVMTLSLASCSLDETNPSGATEAEWTKIAGFEKKINDCYFDMIRVIYGQAEDSFLFEAEGGTDIWADVNPGTNGNYSKLMRYEDFGANCNLMNEGYQGFYGTLNACNGAIKYESLVTDAPQEKVNALAAEAHFIRAHALFNIVEYWGGKYLSTEPTSTEMKSLPMSKVSEFYDVILSDLEFAMKHLPLKQSNQGHVRRATAYHLYAKACLTYATYTDDLCRNWNAEPISQAEAQELLRKGKAAAYELLNNAEMFNTGLYADAKDIFAEANNKDNKEALFVISRSETDLSLNPRGNYPNRTWKKYCAYNNNKEGIYIEGLEPSVKSTPKVLKGDCVFEPNKYMYNLYADRRDSRFDAFFQTVYVTRRQTQPRQPTHGTPLTPHATISMSHVPATQHSMSHWETRSFSSHATISRLPSATRRTMPYTTSTTTMPTRPTRNASSRHS